MVALDTGRLPAGAGAFGRWAAAALALVVRRRGHWETAGGVRVTASEAPPLIYDFGGFPEALYRLTLPVPRRAGARRGGGVLLQACAGWPAEVDPSRGLDHGVWVPLLQALPRRRRLPVVQLSLPRGASAAEVRGMGDALAPLRRQGVLLVGSGGMVHNLRRIDFPARRPRPWAVGARLRHLDGRAHRLARLRRRSSAGSAHRTRALAHPSAEHLLPLFFVLGAALPEDRVPSVFEGLHYGSLSLRTFALRS